MKLEKQLAAIEQAKQLEEVYQKDPVADLRYKLDTAYFSARRCGLTHEEAAAETVLHTRKPGESKSRR
ncbi:hypothetical protein GOV04_02825 [Candidatus Woesearchaeota archaeon]|nr:hypothetical protein [Candidatus Woesearchaeota archaeon]